MHYTDHPAKDSNKFKALVNKHYSIPNIDSSDGHWSCYRGMLRMYLLINNLHTRPENAPYDATHYMLEDGETIWLKQSKRWVSDKNIHRISWARYWISLSGKKQNTGWDDCHNPTDPQPLNLW